jgi:hypothetical protein
VQLKLTEVDFFSTASDHRPAGNLSVLFVHDPIAYDIEPSQNGQGSCAYHLAQSFVCYLEPVSDVIP